jgi:predicted enzyme related to lactoylglutathione lyase
MHKSQLAGFIIDCQTDDVGKATDFWSEALGLVAEKSSDPVESDYRQLLTRPEDIHIEVQKVDHPSRLHLDIEANDIDAEVKRLQALGATRVTAIRRWVVMEAPTGQRFCVVKPVRATLREPPTSGISSLTGVYPCPALG